MADAAKPSDKMGDLQKMRVGLVMLISEESSRLMSRRQRVAGKEIELLCAERDLQQGTDPAHDSDALEAVKRDYQTVKSALDTAEAELLRMEQLLARIDADIAALCHG